MADHMSRLDHRVKPQASGVLEEKSEVRSKRTTLINPDAGPQSDGV